MALDEHGVEIPEDLIVPTSVSVEDFNSLKSSMETQMGELHKMLAQLVEAKGIESPLNPEAPPKEDPPKEAPPKEPSDEGVDGKREVDLTKNESPSKHLMGREKMLEFLLPTLLTYLSLILLYT